MGKFGKSLTVVCSAALVLLAACAPAAPSAPTAAPAKPALSKAEGPAEAKPAEAAKAAAPAASGGTIKLGILLPFSGPVAYPGNTNRQGYELAMEEVGGQAGGKKFELFFEDSAADPAVALTKARKLVEEVKVDVLIGPFLDHEGLAVQEYTKDKNVPTLVPMSGIEARSLNFPQSVNLQTTEKQPTTPLGQYACTKANKKRAIVVASDYAWGHGVAEGFEKGYVGAGCTITDRIFVPVGTADYSPIVTKIASQADRADMVWDWVIVEDGMRFHKAYGELGLDKRLARYSNTDTLYSGLMHQVGASAQGAFIAANWFPEMDVPESKAFVQKLKAKSNTDADWYHASGYHAGQVVSRVYEKLGGKTGDAKAFLDTLLALEMKDSVFGGNYRFHKEMRAPYFNIYIAEIVAAPGGGVTRKIVDTIPDVSPKFN
jgi:branched-chain amino acid transport system substrate-binding protein